MSLEKENDVNISNSKVIDDGSKADEKIPNEIEKQENGDEVDKKSGKEQELNEAEQSYVMSDEDENDDSEDDDDSPDCPEIQKLIYDDETMSELMALYSKELYLVDETPEERKVIDENPNRPVLTMRNTSSSAIMHGLIAGWIKDIKKLPEKEPDAIFRKLLVLSLAMFRDDHWVCDTDTVDVVYFLVKEVGVMWKNLLKKPDDELKINDVLRRELVEIFLYYKDLLHQISTDQGWVHPIEFIYTQAKPKYRVLNNNLDELVENGESTRAVKYSNWKWCQEEEKKKIDSNKGGEPEIKKVKGSH